MRPAHEALGVFDESSGRNFAGNVGAFVARCCFNGDCDSDWCATGDDSGEAKAIAGNCAWICFGAADDTEPGAVWLLDSSAVFGRDRRAYSGDRTRFVCAAPDI